MENVCGCTAICGGISLDSLASCLMSFMEDLEIVNSDDDTTWNKFKGRLSKSWCGADHDMNMIFHIGKNTRTSSLTMCASICIECWRD